MSTKSTLSCFLSLLNYNNVYQLPYNNDAHILALHMRNNQRLTGKDLIKQNIKREAHRLHFYSQRIINLATNKIWNKRSTSSQRNQFISLASNANNINQIVRLTVPQITDDPFKNIFFNGVNFDHGNNNFESLFLPAGCLNSFSFP